MNVSKKVIMAVFIVAFGCLKAESTEETSEVVAVTQEVGETVKTQEIPAQAEESSSNKQVTSQTDDSQASDELEKYLKELSAEFDEADRVK